jgi:hypothetical protein
MHLEDFLPKDPREVVLTRTDDAVLRLFPGSVERPARTCAARCSSRRSPTTRCVRNSASEVRDLLTAAVAFIDRAVALMAPVWPSGELAGEGPVVLTAAELDASRRVGRRYDSGRARVLAAAGAGARLGNRFHR